MQYFPVLSIQIHPFGTSFIIASLTVLICFFSVLIDDDDLESSKVVIANGCVVAVGSPNRIAQLVSKGLLSLAQCKMAVLDNADQMMITSYREDVE